MNVCSLKQKLKYPEFKDFINRYDIIGLCETKLTDFDVVEVDNFKIVCNNRKQKCIRESGGISFLIKTELLNIVKVLPNKSEFVQCIQIVNNKPNVDDVYIIMTYLPPEGSKFAN